MNRFLLIASAVLMTACTHAAPEPKVEIKTVYVPTPVSCVPESLGAPPAYVASPADLQRTAGPDDLLMLLGALVKQQWARLAEVEPVVSGCR